MTDILSLDEGYSTTRLLTQEKPEIINTPEDKFETFVYYNLPSAYFVENFRKNLTYKMNTNIFINIKKDF